jgi:3-hydroxyisobutyrate dehydrogenase
MVENLLKKGRPLVALDIYKAKVRHFVELGALAVTGPADAARQEGIVISMVDATVQAEGVLAVPDGFIQAGQSGDVLIRVSTIDLVAVRRLHPKLAAMGFERRDSAVTGMQKGVKDGVAASSDVRAIDGHVCRRTRVTL